MKNKLIMFFAILLLFFLVSCRSFDIVNPKTYGKWDNNYMYLGNMKCQTDGENEEYLVESIEYNEIKYIVSSCLSYLIRNKNIYMILNVRDDTLNDNNTVLVEYNCVDTKYRILFFEGYHQYNDSNAYYNLFDILELYDDSIILYVNKRTDEHGFKSDYIAIDYSGNIIKEEINGKVTRRLENGYLIYYDYETKTLYYRENYFNDEKTIIKFNGTEYHNLLDFEVIENENTYGLSFKVKTSKETKLYFYSFNLGKMVESIAINNNVVANNKYIYKYETKEVNYFSFFNANGKETVHINNSLYKINYSDSGLSYTFVYDFNENNVIDDFGVYFDEIIMFSEEKYYYPSCEHKSGGYFTDYYQYNLKTEKLEKIDKDEFESVSLKWSILDESSKATIECNEYKYFIYVDYVQAFMTNKNDTYTLERLNTKTNEIEAMQFFIYSSYNGNHYNSKFWSDYNRQDNKLYLDLIVVLDK